jgi:Protein phosphatase 2C
MAGSRNARGFRLARRGLTADECEDAWAIDAEATRVAVSDGATESAYPGVWARLLVEQFTREAGDWPGWIAQVQPRWLDAVQQAGALPLPWFVEQSLARGAFATFLGVCLAGESAEVVAVGDSCLFHVRDDRLERSFPLEDSSEFGNTPWLIGSRTSPDEVPRRRGKSCRLDLMAGDRLWLMTDALARWFLMEAEASRRPWDALGELQDLPDEEWAAWVETLRDTRELRNDDTTVVVVTISVSPGPREPG